MLKHLLNTVVVTDLAVVWCRDQHVDAGGPLKRFLDQLLQNVTFMSTVISLLALNTGDRCVDIDTILIRLFWTKNIIISNFEMLTDVTD